MLIKILGVLDLVGVATVIALSYGFDLPTRIVIGLAVYLIAKGLIFKGDIPSMIDVACGVYIIVLFAGGFSTVVSVLVALYLFQKAVVSLG